MRKNVAILSVYFLAVLSLHAETNAYENLATIHNTMLSLTNSTGGDAVCFRITDSTGAVIWTEGGPISTNIYCLKMAKNGTETGRTNILMTGTQHAREWIGYRCVLHCAEFVISNRNSTTWPTNAFFDHFRKFKDMNISNLTDNVNIYAIPVANPAGYYYSKSNDTPGTGETDGWRKNRRDTSGDANPGTNWHYTESNDVIPGVDLNRNWPTTDWGDDEERAGQQIATSRFTNDLVYCGKPLGNSWTNNPFRPPIYEKEVEGIISLSTDKTFHCVIDMHSFTGSVGWAGNADTNSVHLRPNQCWATDKEVMQLLAGKTAALLGTPYMATIVYPVSGDILWYHYDKASSKALTFFVEVGTPADGYRPTNATEHANTVLPGELFMMFSAVDKRVLLQNRHTVSENHSLRLSALTSKAPPPTARKSSSPAAQSSATTPVARNNSPTHFPVSHFHAHSA